MDLQTLVDAFEAATTFEEEKDALRNIVGWMFNKTKSEVSSDIEEITNSQDTKDFLVQICEVNAPALFPLEV